MLMSIKISVGYKMFVIAIKMNLLPLARYVEKYIDNILYSVIAHSLVQPSGSSGQEGLGQEKAKTYRHPWFLPLS